MQSFHFEFWTGQRTSKREVLVDATLKPGKNVKITKIQATSGKNLKIRNLEWDDFEFLATKAYVEGERQFIAYSKSQEIPA